MILVSQNVVCFAQAAGSIDSGDFREVGPNDFTSRFQHLLLSFSAAGETRYKSIG